TGGISGAGFGGRIRCSAEVDTDVAQVFVGNRCAGGVAGDELQHADSAEALGDGMGIRTDAHLDDEIAVGGGLHAIHPRDVAIVFDGFEFDHAVAIEGFDREFGDVFLGKGAV